MLARTCAHTRTQTRTRSRTHLSFCRYDVVMLLMLVYVAQLFLDWLVRGPWRNPEGFNFPESRQFHADALLPEIMPELGRAHWGFILALVAAALVWFLLNKTLLPSELNLILSGLSFSKVLFIVSINL